MGHPTMQENDTAKLTPTTNDCSISIDLGNNQSESNYNIELILDGKAYTGEFTTNEI